ncbi:hypothetical protein HMPREF1279_01225 [Propionibacterium sp. KPL1852]|nr:hypothetical protein H639_08088 [Cutibacterium avidum TM16]ERS23729.1 hypothetical protein HMPREF1301_01534 [Propionibacterium sp. KPL2005]ERS30411.1 hypothetical protein HMPREF1297_01243 [Propionibacterium sp. KPL2000]ERS40440.1 hypothetical protein HMPREF1271_00057 [Propionibacterium sp. KPL1838]ERS68853.1 hypothetical protein HMPREF1279_01225 [Propionibacterium sp. KPL1852]
MAVQRKILVSMESVFPAGAFLVGQVEPVWNFDKAVQRPDGSRPQQLDKDTGLPIWQVPVLDMDPEAGQPGQDRGGEADQCPPAGTAGQQEQPADHPGDLRRTVHHPVGR